MIQINIMKAFKLFRKRKDGTLGSLFINRQAVLPMDQWLDAACHPTSGFAVRPGWHCCSQPEAPHLKLQLKSGEQRVWCSVEIEDHERHTRPVSQGGVWYTANKLKIKEIIKEKTDDE